MTPPTNEATGVVEVEADPQGYVVSWRAEGGDLVRRRVDQNGVLIRDSPTLLIPGSEGVGWHALEYRGGDG